MWTQSTQSHFDGEIGSKHALGLWNELNKCTCACNWCYINHLLMQMLVRYLLDWAGDGVLWVPWVSLTSNCSLNGCFALVLCLVCEGARLVFLCRVVSFSFAYRYFRVLNVSEWELVMKSGAGHEIFACVCRMWCSVIWLSRRQFSCVLKPCFCVKLRKFHWYKLHKRFHTLDNDVLQIPNSANSKMLFCK